MKILLALYLSIFICSQSNAKIMTYTQVHDLTKSILTNAHYNLINMEIKDSKSFCPNYENLSNYEKEDFISHLIAQISQYESNYNTDTIFMENNGNISTGLLQISFPSISKKYKENGCNEIKGTKDLKDAEKNIKCGLAIMTSLIQFNGYLSNSKKASASSYWSTLRRPYAIYIKSINRTVHVGKKYEIIDGLKKKYKICFD